MVRTSSHTLHVTIKGQKCKNYFQVWNKLVDKKGKIKKSTGDYSVRKGLTQKPLADVQFIGSLDITLKLTLLRKLFIEITILHLWIHALTFILKIAVHLRCGHLQYFETADIKGDCEEALKEIQQVCLPHLLILFL